LKTSPEVLLPEIGFSMREGRSRNSWWPIAVKLSQANESDPTGTPTLAPPPRP